MNSQSSIFETWVYVSPTKLDNSNKSLNWEDNNKDKINELNRKKSPLEIKSPIGYQIESFEGELPIEIKSEVYHTENKIITINNKNTEYKKFGNIPEDPTYDHSNNIPINEIQVELKKIENNIYIPIEYSKLAQPIEKVYPKANWEDPNGIIWDIIGKDINSKDNDFWDNCRKKDIKALSKAFGMGYIDFANEFDFRIQIITDFINKVRQGIKSKIVCKKNANKLSKSKGYKSYHYEKNLETAKVAIQEAYIYCFTKNKPLSLWNCILSAQKVMKLEKKFNNKLDYILWKMRKALVVESYLNADGTPESYIKEVTHNEKEDKLNDLKYKLLNFNPKVKLEKKWQEIMTGTMVENKSRRELAVFYGISKRRINQIIQFIPSDFMEYEKELKSYAMTYYKK